MRYLIILFGSTLALFLAACDSGEDEQLADGQVTATLVEHHYQGGDSLAAGTVSGFAEPISLEGAWSASGLEPGGGSFQWSGFSTGPDFLFHVEQCEGDPVIRGGVLLADDEDEPRLAAPAPSAAARSGTGPCTLYIFAVEGFGSPPSGRLSFVRGDQPFEIDLAGYVVEGEPAIAATAEDFEFRAGPEDVLSSSFTLSGAAEGAVPLEVYRLNDGFAYWNARADGGGYLGTVSSGEPLEGIRYFVFLLDLDS